MAEPSSDRPVSVAGSRPQHVDVDRVGCSGHPSAVAPRDDARPLQHAVDQVLRLAPSLHSSSVNCANPLQRGKQEPVSAEQRLEAVQRVPWIAVGRVVLGEVGQKCQRLVAGVFGRPDGHRRWGCPAISGYRDIATGVGRPDTIEIAKAVVRGMRSLWGAAVASGR